MTNKVHIDAPAGIIGIEGEKDFVEGLLAKLFPIIEKVGFGSNTQNSNDELATGADLSSLGEPEPIKDSDRPKITRRRGSSPPKGQSCSDRIMTLKADGFFKDHRVGVDIVAGLKAKGWTHNSSQVAAAAVSLFERGLLQRTKEGNGAFRYYWDRD